MFKSKNVDFFFIKMNMYILCKILHKMSSNTKKDKTKIFLGIHPNLNQEIYAMEINFGPVIQILDIETNKSRYAPIKAPLTLDIITLDDAIEILKYPKILGYHNNKPVTLHISYINNIYLTYDNKFIVLRISKEEIDNYNLSNAIEIISNQQ